MWYFLGEENHIQGVLAQTVTFILNVLVIPLVTNGYNIHFINAI